MVEIAYFAVDFAIHEFAGAVLFCFGGAEAKPMRSENNTYNMGAIREQHVLVNFVLKDSAREPSK